MEDSEAYSLSMVVLGIAGVVVMYYLGTRGVLRLTRNHAGRWHRRALVSLSFAVLFAPSLAGVGHGGTLPAPAWMVALDYARAGIAEGALRWGLMPIFVTAAIFFGLSSFSSALSRKNNHEMVDTGKEGP